MCGDSILSEISLLKKYKEKNELSVLYGCKFSSTPII